MTDTALAAATVTALHPTARTNGQALVATITRPRGKRVRVGASTNQSWQHDAWTYWEALPELMYPTTQLARLCGRMQWNVDINGVRLDRDPDQPDATDEFFAEVTDGLGVVEAVRLLALNIQVAGECWYVNTDDPHADRRSDSGPVLLDPIEDDTRTRTNLPDGWTVLSIADPALKVIDDRGDWIRCHVKITHPRDQTLAISPFAALIGPAEELSTLSALSRAQTRSRISQAGILLRPKEAQFPLRDPVTGARLDPFGDQLAAAMAAPIADEHSPEALAPIDFEVPGATIDQFRHLTFDRNYDDQVHEKIERVTRRIALGLDIPPELLTGMGDTSHWNAWQIDEDVIKTHAIPLATAIGEVFAFAAEQMLNYEPGQVVVTPDPSELLARRSTVRDAFSGYDRGVIGAEPLRAAMGASQEDAATAEDIDRIITLRAPTFADDAGITVDDNAGGDDPQPEPDRGPPDDTNAPVAAAIGPDDSDAELDRFGEALAAFDRDLRSQLVGAMDMAVMRARARVGAKVRNAVTNPDDRQAIDGVPNGDVVATLGVAAYELVDVDATIRDTLAGDLAVWWTRRAAAAQAQLADVAPVDTAGIEWAEAASASAGLLIDQTVAWTVAAVARTSADALTVPAGIARDVVAVAGGS